jgi:hypothetical protein
LPFGASCRLGVPVKPKEGAPLAAVSPRSVRN